MAEAEGGEAAEDVRVAHEGVPEQAGAVVLYHADDRALVYGDVTAGEPLVFQREGVVEALFTPDAFAQVVVEVFESRKRLLRRVRHT